MKNKKKKNTAEKKAPVRPAFRTVVLYIIIVSLLLTGVTLSRYTGETNGEIHGRAANFNIVINEGGMPANNVIPRFFEGGRFNNGTLAFNQSALTDKTGYSFTVTNNSEVSVECTFSAMDIADSANPLKMTNVTFSPASIVINPNSTSSAISVTIKSLKSGTTQLADNYQKMRIEVAAVQVD